MPIEIRSSKLIPVFSNRLAINTTNLKFRSISRLFASSSPWKTILGPGIEYILDENDGYYHELRSDGSIGSIIYCDFTSIPNIASDSYSLEQLIQHGFFDFTEFEGEDYTAKMRLYSAKNKITEGELSGCVPVDEELKEILEVFMDVHAGFAGVEHQWLKTCCYYQYYGPSLA